MQIQPLSLDLTELKRWDCESGSRQVSGDILAEYHELMVKDILQPRSPGGIGDEDLAD